MDTIEYIGPRPEKRARKPWAGGWPMILLVVFTVILVTRPYISSILAKGNPTDELIVEETIVWLSNESDFGNQLAITALERTNKEISYDPAYYKISYPNGDIPDDKGVCTDVVVRCYRALGLDLQKLVYEDMEKNFRIYPQLWEMKSPDSNIDHRRVPNLQRFFTRFGDELPLDELSEQKEENFDHGDIIAWRLPDGATHIGIVVPGPANRRGEKWIVHNLRDGPKWENKLFEYQIIGHYRYDGSRTDLKEGDSLQVAR